MGIKMAFYIYEQPAFSMEHFHPGFYLPLRSMGRPRQWNLLEKLFNDEEAACHSSQSCCPSRSANESEEKLSNSTKEENKMEVEVEKINLWNQSPKQLLKGLCLKFLVKKQWKELKSKSNLVGTNLRLKI